MKKSENLCDSKQRKCGSISLWTIQKQIQGHSAESTAICQVLHSRVMPNVPCVSVLCQSIYRRTKGAGHEIGTIRCVNAVQVCDQSDELPCRTVGDATLVKLAIHSDV